MQQRLPEIRFDLLPLALGEGFIERFDASAAVLREDPPLDGPELRSDRLDAYYTLSRPFAVGDWFAFTPMAGARVTHYADTLGAATAGGYTRTRSANLASTPCSAPAAPSTTRTPRGVLDGLRHLFTPVISYRYIPEGDDQRARPHPDDRPGGVFHLHLQPLGLR